MNKIVFTIETILLFCYFSAVMYKRILTIQDISCVGQCSLTVALPILSACGLETAVLPSAILSTHTGGFKGYFFRDLTDDMMPICEHWKKEGIRFDAFYTGYLGSARQVDFVRSILSSTGVDGAIKVIDPAMADFGKLYSGFDESFVETMKGLCCEADILLPNITEASLLTGMEFKEVYDEAYVHALCEKLLAQGAKCIVLTGVGFRDGYTGVAIYENNEMQYYEHKKIMMGCHGTGDVYASAFVGAVLHGKSKFEAAKIAADYTLRCIENTVDDKAHWYGVKFETALPELMEMLD